MKRKVISLILALVLCVSLAVPAFAFTIDGSTNQAITGSDGFVFTFGVSEDSKAKYIGTVERQDSSDREKFPVAVFYTNSPSPTFTLSVNKAASVKIGGYTYFAEDIGAGGFGPDIYDADGNCLGGNSPNVDNYDPVTVEANKPVYIRAYTGVGYVQACSITVLSDGKEVGGFNFYYMEVTDESARKIMQMENPGHYPYSTYNEDGSARNEVLIYHGLAELLTKAGLGTPPPAPALTAKPTASTVLVNGKTVAFDAYNINGNNYFKLRDLAYALNGSEKQFEVGWDGAKNAISLTSGKAYTAVGGEMTGKGAGDKTPTTTSSKIYLDGREVAFTAYNIDGNNYFKLRDIGLTFDFSVEWDGSKNTIVIDTGKGYTPE